MTLACAHVNPCVNNRICSVLPQHPTLRCLTPTKRRIPPQTFSLSPSPRSRSRTPRTSSLTGLEVWWWTTCLQTSVEGRPEGRALTMALVPVQTGLDTWGERESWGEVSGRRGPHSSRLFWGLFLPLHLYKRKSLNHEKCIN